MSDLEIVVNAWYVCDDDGVIYSLRLKAYAAEGSDESKLAFLRSRSSLDYLVADSFEIPERFHLHIVEGTSETILPVSHVQNLHAFGGSLALFEDALRELEARMPAQTPITIGESPLVCLTALVQSEEGDLKPRVGDRRPFGP